MKPKKQKRNLFGLAFKSRCRQPVMHPLSSLFWKELGAMIRDVDSNLFYDQIISGIVSDIGENS